MLHIHPSIQRRDGCLSSRPRMAAPGQAADGKPDSASIVGEADERNRSLGDIQPSQLVSNGKNRI